jgi:hypothetical protein
MTNGYSLDEMLAFGFFDWTLTATRPATEEEAPYGCSYYEECPCCECGEDVVAVEDYARPRWSKSSKRMVEQTDRVWVCADHATKH